MKTDIDSLLKPFQRFGISLGLERIENLLASLNNPHYHVPIIHVAGSNGKGSVCAYLSSILTEAGYKVGRYTSPHLINWNERIYLNEKPIKTEDFICVLSEVKSAINSNQELPTLFEIITAVAWLYFAQQKVDIAIIEVGLGGRLDATNVCDNPLVSIITSISKEHWQVLGSTLDKIASEKAGILKQNCPAIIGKLPIEAKQVIENKINELNCPSIWIEKSQELIKANTSEKWAIYEDIEYPLSLLGDIQLLNSAMAIASIKILQQKGWEISLNSIQNGMRKTQWRGRIEWINWRGNSILIDGAHNPASAQVLRQYIDTLNKPIIWIMGMLSTKDHSNIFQTLLRPKDHLYLVPVADHSSAKPEELAKLALNICPQLTQINTETDIFITLNKAIINYDSNERLIVICGSLYLLGYFLANN